MHACIRPSYAIPSHPIHSSIDPYIHTEYGQQWLPATSSAPAAQDSSTTTAFKSPTVVGWISCSTSRATNSGSNQAEALCWRGCRSWQVCVKYVRTNVVIAYHACITLHSRCVYFGMLSNICSMLCIWMCVCVCMLFIFAFTCYVIVYVFKYTHVNVRMDTTVSPTIDRPDKLQVG